MGSDDNILHIPQGAAFGQGLGRSNVKGSAEEMAFCHYLFKGGGIDKAAAACIDQHCALLHQAQAALIQQTCRFRRTGQHAENVIGKRKLLVQLFEGIHLVKALGDAAGHAAHARNSHAERLKAAGGADTYITRAENEGALALEGQLAAQIHPAAAAGISGNEASQCHGAGHHMLGNNGAESSAGIGHGYLCGHRARYCIHTRPCCLHQLQVLCFLKQRGLNETDEHLGFAHYFFSLGSGGICANFEEAALALACGHYSFLVLLAKYGGYNYVYHFAVLLSFFFIIADYRQNVNCFIRVVRSIPHPRSAEGGAPCSISGIAVNNGMGRPIPYKVDLSLFAFRRAGACPCRMHRTLFLPC